MSEVTRRSTVSGPSSANALIADVRLQTPIHIACDRGEAKRLKIILKSKHPPPVNVYDPSGLMPLHLACRGGHYKCVEILLKRGDLDINALSADDNAATPLHFACLSKQGSLKTVDLLLKDKRPDPARLDSQNGNV